MGRRTTRKMRMAIDEIGSIIPAKSTGEAIEKFCKSAAYYNLDPTKVGIGQGIWTPIDISIPKEEGFYITVNEVPTFKNLYQFSVKYFDMDTNCFGDISTTGWVQLPDLRIPGRNIYQYTVTYPCKDDILAWIKVPISYSSGKLLITPAIASPGAERSLPKLRVRPLIRSPILSERRSLPISFLAPSL